ncbi:hypothetical protein [Aliarcobacter butzleri]|uniref:hypothetical protein n=1 Tax=Aliarcobacter butzleri TaxID=28197 RepID=UPI0021B21F10|nr:hypothetical protein [Aliarcobacter butzleri]MCT7598996.1 hypothetical protein [Aliarcobacter butzleri]MCT7632169.1 hypothetical protein [Aliarcobacter butzleri]
MIENKIDVIESEIKEDKELELVKFDVNLLENQQGKYSTLVNNQSDDFTYEFKNKIYSFNFIKPIFIANIRFVTLNGTDLKGFEIIPIDYNKNEKSSIIFYKDSRIWSPYKILYGFKINVPKRLIDKIKLSKIEILGFDLDYLTEITNKYSKLKEFKGELNSLLEEIKEKNSKTDEKVKIHENKLVELNKKIDTNNETIKSLNEVIENLENNILTKLNEEKEKLEKENEKIKTRNEELGSKNTNLENNIKQLNESSSSLNIKIATLKDELQKLTEDSNLFATELSEYITQGNKDIKLYTWLSVIPWILISIVTGIMFYGSSELTTIYSLVTDGVKDKIDISTVFWSRMPFVIIVVSILFVCYEISKMFIKNIIHIQKQKRIFMKIGIIAKDVADQSILGLDLTENEKFELRTKLKMDLLKSHLSNDIGENYDYKVNTSLLDYYNDYKLRKEKKIQKQNEESEKIN